MPQNRTNDRAAAGQFQVSIDYGSHLPVYKQISEGIRRSILDGRIPCGVRVPSTRELAQILGVNRLTVLKSFGELVNKGMVETIIGAGTFVIHKPETEMPLSFHPPDDGKEAGPVQISAFASSIMVQRAAAAAPDVVSTSGILSGPRTTTAPPVIEELPIDRWQHLLGRATRILRTAPGGAESSIGGSLRLRKTLADYLQRARGVECSAEQMVFLSQPHLSSHLICRLLLNPGDAVAIEDPGCISARNTLNFYGARTVPIPVDQHGLVAEQLFNCDESIKLLFVTPSHQDPTGAELTLPRRFDLLKWAQHNGSIIVEDDYDSEFRYGEPVPPMVHADTHGNVIYRYSFGRILHPLVRSGFLVLPPGLVSLFQRAIQMLDLEASPFEQRALSDFIAEGHYERYLKRLRTIYASRRAYVIQGLTVNFGKAVAISNNRAGRQILITLQSEHPDEHLLACARKASFPMVSTSSNYLSNEKRGEFLIDCSAAPEDEIRRACDIFAALVQTSGDRIESLLGSWLPSVPPPVMVELA